ncbi:MAG: hypothetical protein ACREQC_01545 [Candidatus Binataceae bacterium]
MSSTPNTPAPAGATILDTLSGLAKANSYVALGLEVADVVVPIVKGVISEIKQISTGDGTVAYTVLIQADESELSAVDTLSESELAAINAELTRLGAPTLSVPAAAPETAPAKPSPS